jgi:hypothetical protein
MKKLIFLLLMAVMLASLGFAGAAHPPGANSLEAVNLELAGYGVRGDGVNLQAALVAAIPVTAEPPSFQKITAIYETAMRPQPQYAAEADYHLRF